MAARISRHHAEEVRKKIQASVIIDRLHKHFDGKLELTRTQIKAAEILLDRSVSKLQTIQGSADDGAHVLRVIHETA